MLPMMGMGIVLNRRRYIHVLRRLTVCKNNDERPAAIDDLRVDARRGVFWPKSGVAATGVRDVSSRAVSVPTNAVISSVPLWNQHRWWQN